MLTPEEEAIAERRSRFMGRQIFAFWPMVDDIDDIDRVTQLGYWVCFVYAIWNSIPAAEVLIFSQASIEKTVTAILLPANFAFYFVAANAVRRSSVTAAALLAAIACLVPFETYLGSKKLDPTEIGVAVLFIIVLRGTWLTSRWLETFVPNERQDAPLRISQILPFQIHGKLTKLLVDDWPPLIWPRFRYLFWILGLLLLGVFVANFVLDRV